MEVDFEAFAKKALSDHDGPGDDIDFNWSA